MIDFLLEIGVEEFPPSYLPKTSGELCKKIEELLKKERIFFRTIRRIYTSRRIGAIILGLARKQKSQVVEVQGPPGKFAYDENGKPTQMLTGFMNAHNLKPGEVKIAKTKKGEYVVATKEVAGRGTDEILENEVPKILASLEFPKTMIWNDSGTRFPRPVRWIIALLDRKPLRFKYAGVEADRYSMPNFHFSFKPIRLEKPREYMNFLRHGGVVVDPKERRKIILTRIKQLANSLKGEPVYDEAMLEEINSTTEYPDAVSGEFDPSFLELPEEVLKTALKALGNLIWIQGTNKFLCVYSARKRAAANIAAGYSKVLRARLYDALFFYQNDLQLGIENMLTLTRGMVWLKGLGSIYDKTARLEKFCDSFSGIDGLDMAALKKSALLCKADLLSNMVREKEFTSLQGIVGYYYAKAAKEDEIIALAIRDHYRPGFIGDSMPATLEGTVLSSADKIDNVVGAFLSGQKPSGSYDPLGVRRNGYAVVNMLDANSLDISLFEKIDTLLKLYERDFEIRVFIQEFFQERLARYLQDKGFRYDEIDAVITCTKGNAFDSRLRCEALKNFRDKQEFVQLVIGQKRVRNILKGIKEFSELNPALFELPAEKTLHERGRDVAENLTLLLAEKNYVEILRLLLGMRKDIDKFFDDVMVMCEDKNKQRNRLALVDYINQLFFRFADLSKIVIEGEKDKKEA